ncbi:MAG TPA: hypothetical protein VIW64_19285 [Pyrinomonadaceae bacterium]|jgi:hypothetical protein
MSNNNNEADFGSGTNISSDASTIERIELEQLSAKAAEVVQEAALAFERIKKNQEEIEQLKAETRAMLKALRAA